MLSVFLNGQFLDAADRPALLSAFDAGIQHGVGLFETMLGRYEPDPSRGDSACWVVHLEEHLERLADSARTLGLASALHLGPLGDAVLETLRRSGLRRARVRLTVTGGDLNLLASARAAGAQGPASPSRHDPTILIVAQPATEYPPAMLDRGVAVTLADTRVSPLDPTASHKTLNYWWRLRELQSAGAKGAGEALVFSVTNHLVGGCVSSAILVKGGELIVPMARGEEGAATAAPGDPARGVAPAPGARTKGVLPSATLPGVTRHALILAAEGLGILTKRRMVTIDDVLAADELLLTNSSWGVLPVARVESATIGAGTPGPVGRDLRQAWDRWCESPAP